MLRFFCEVMGKDPLKRIVSVNSSVGGDPDKALVIFPDLPYDIVAYRGLIGRIGHERKEPPSVPAVETVPRPHPDYPLGVLEQCRHGAVGEPVGTCQILDRILRCTCKKSVQKQKVYCYETFVHRSWWLLTAI